MITSSGPRCDVCGKYILPIGDEMVNRFTVQGIDRTLDADNKCKALVLAAKRWQDLPTGPLRKAFEDANAQEKGVLYV